jgi:hypothetical protein
MVPAAPSRRSFLSSYELLLQRLIYLKNFSELEISVELDVLLQRLFSDVPYTFWMLAPLEAE